MERTPLALLVVLLLAGCSPTYTDGLQQQLTDKSPDQKRAILAQECGSEIAKGLKKDDSSSVRHAQKMKEICEDMTGQKIKVDNAKPTTPN